MHTKKYRSIRLAVVLAIGLFAAFSLSSQLHAQDASNSVAGTPDERMAALKLEMTNAWQRVLQIVNQPVKAYVRSGSISVSTYSPGWFHVGANKPDFNTVDVRQSQELTYAKDRFVTSDLNPGLVFVGQDLEFNSNTKYFYTNRTVPKKKLTEPEMVEINSLYRVIGRCEDQIRALKISAMPAPAAAAATTDAATDVAQPSNTGGDTETVVPGQSFEGIRAIPKKTRILYGSIAIGALLVLMIVLRIFGKKKQ